MTSANAAHAMTARWFGDYEILQRLRVGGMATLHLARRHGAAGFSRLVALKMVHPHLAEQPSFIDMFVDEARICAQISHANVVHVEEFGVLDGVHYLVMEYIDGCSACELLQVLGREGRLLDPELAARVILQVAGGLHAAHETCGPDGQPLDLIHRDISPSNILVSVDGGAKLIDFGIAKARNRVSETQAGYTLKGKCRYVAPEQALRAAVDRRCDIFSLGVVFWELLTGRHLFPDDDYPGLLDRLHRTDAPAPSTVNADVPAVFDPVVLAMLQHDPANRPQTAAEVQRRIASAIPGAANREAAELGALATRVRDKCAARRARRANTESGSDSDRNFSPIRSSRPQTSAEHGAGPEAIPGEGVEDAPPPPSGWWRRHGAGVAAGLVGAALAFGVALGRRGAESERRTSTPPPRREREVELVMPHDPATRRESPRLRPTMPSPPVVVATSPIEPSAPARSATATAPRGDVSSVPGPAAAGANAVGAASIPEATARGPAGAVMAGTVPGPVASVPVPGLSASLPGSPASPGGSAVSPPASTPRREVARSASRPRPPRPVAPDAGSARPAPPLRVIRPAVKTPFATESFDDQGNTSGVPATHDVMKDKPAPIVPQFDN